MSDTKNMAQSQSHAANSIDSIQRAPSSQQKDTAVAVVNAAGDEGSSVVPADKVDDRKKGFLAYFKTKEFYITLALGCVFPGYFAHSARDRAYFLWQWQR